MGNNDKIVKITPCTKTQLEILTQNVMIYCADLMTKASYTATVLPMVLCWLCDLCNEWKVQKVTMHNTDRSKPDRKPKVWAGEEKL